jgi:hypothetical protein
MAIQRTGNCPDFFSYVTERALIPRSNPVTPQFQQITQFNFSWIDIPSYQRGLVWDDELFEELLDSTSVFIGNAILGSFPVPANHPDFSGLPATVTNYEILIDGLQRFSIGTALLTLLYPQVLAPQPLRPGDAPYFAALAAKAASAVPVFQHNDQELEKHRRDVVRDSYQAFKRMLGFWIENELKRQGGSQKLATRLNHLLLLRQIAPDTYFGFGSPYDVTKTFIGLNTIRAPLDIVDWLRSIIIDRGADATSGGNWPSPDVERIDNRFTEVFTRQEGQPETELRPFVAITKTSLEDTVKAPHVFPNWNNNIQPTDVENFLDFVEAMFDHNSNPYLREVRACGAIPFAACIAYYYRLLTQTGNRPTFLTNGNNEDAELLDFLRANYRVLFDSQIGRTRSFAEKLLVDPAYTLSQAADDISVQFIGVPLGNPVNRDWLVAALKQSDKKRAPRIFNACILPTKGAPAGGFTPQLYGKKTSNYQIDHLIPESALQSNRPGEPEGHLLGNFAPIRRSANNRQTNVQCSVKLAAGGSFESEINNDPTHHPFIDWLVQHQRAQQSFLDRQDLLQPNSTPPIGEERIAWIADRLLGRL